jgi:hypothetical protein
MWSRKQHSEVESICVTDARSQILQFLGLDQFAEFSLAAASRSPAVSASSLRSSGACATTPY